MLVVQMLDLDGAVVEECQPVHVCVGDPNQCERPAICEDHGDKASRDNPVYCWSTADGMTFFACGSAVTDEYSRLVER